MPGAGLSQLLALAALQRPVLPYAGGPIMGPPLGQVGIPVAIPPIQQAQVQLWQGQFPPPDAVEKYEKVLPGSFDRMIAMAERLQAAQIEETRRAQDYTRNDLRRGHWLGFSATLLAIVGASACTLVGAIMHENGPLWVAGLLVGVPVMAVAKSLVESARTPTPQEIMQVAGSDTGTEKSRPPADAAGPPSASGHPAPSA